MEKFGENGDFDGAGGGEDFVGVEGDRVVRGEVEDVDAEDAVERFVGVLDGGVEFLPEEEFFWGDGLLGGQSMRRKKGN